MGNSLPNESSKKTRLARRMSPENYEQIVKPSGKKTGKDQLDYIKEKGFIKKYEEPYVIDGHTLEYYIPVGTKLYHSSFTFYQKFDKDRVTYFGIDIIIALWYLFEESPKYNGDNFGYIYEFIVKKNIPVYILENIIDHPYNYSGVGTICQKKEIACIHPQYAYHGHSMDYRTYKEMSTELTMYLNNYKITDYIERAIHPKTEKEIIYLADIRKLKEIAELEKEAGKTLPYSEHNSIKQSIVGMVPDKNLNKTIEQSIVGMVPNKNPNNNSKNSRSRSSNKKGGYRHVLRKTKKTHYKSRNNDYTFSTY